MNTIHAFGDSYVMDPSPDFSGWTRMFATDVNMNLKNYGMPGASTQYAFKKFMENKHDFRDGDIVIFSFSSPGRLHLEFQNKDPSSASHYLRVVTERGFYDNFFKQIVPENSIKRIWYDENKDHINWYVRNRDLELEKINETAYRNLIKMESINNPGIKYIVTQMNKRTDWEDFKFDTLNFLEIPLSLREISDNELYNGQHLEFIDSIKEDPRKNHMSIKNLRMFNQLIQESVSTGSTQNFTYDRFDQKIFYPIITLNDYDFYVDSGHLYNIKRIRERLNDKQT